MVSNAKVIITPTDDASFLLLDTMSGNKLSLMGTKSKCLMNGMFNKHLCVYSDEKIKNGDWYLNIKTSSVGQHNGADILLFKEDRKIIYTTDDKLSLPMLPIQFVNEFISEFNKGHGFVDVVITRLKRCIECGAEQLDSFHSCQYPRGGSNCGGKLVDAASSENNNEKDKPKTMEYKISKPCDFTPKYDETYVISLIEEKIKKYSKKDIIDDGFIQIFIPTAHISDDVIRNVEEIYKKEWGKVKFSPASDSPDFCIYLFLNK